MYVVQTFFSRLCIEPEINKFVRGLKIDPIHLSIDFHPFSLFELSLPFIHELILTYEHREKGVFMLPGDHPRKLHIIIYFPLGDNRTPIERRCFFVLDFSPTEGASLSLSLSLSL